MIARDRSSGVIVHESVVRGQSGLDAFGRDVADVVSGLWRGRWLILAAVGAGFVLALLFVLLSTPLYLSTTQLLIDPRSKRILQGEVVPGGLGTSSSGSDALLVDSQTEIIQSDAVLRRVVAERKLDQDQEFATGGGPGVVTSLRALIGQRPPPAASPTDLAVERLRRLLRVKRVGNTYIIDVGVFSREPDKAAAIANAISATYLAQLATITSSSTRETTEFLTSRLDGLRRSLAQAEDKVEAYRRQNGLIGTQGVLVDEQQLQDMNASLSAARVRREGAQSRFDQAQRMAKRGPSSAAASDGLDSPALATLRTRLAEADQAIARLQLELGPSHPSFRQLQAQRGAIAAQLNREVGVLVERARNDLDLARQNETSITAGLEQLKRRSLRNNEAQIKLRELQREADAARSLLETVLARAKQSGQQEDLPSDNFRVLAPAVAGHSVVYPPSLVVIAAGLGFGLLIGALAAWLDHRFDRHSAPRRFSA